MLDSLRHVRLDIRTGTRWLTALAVLIDCMGSAYCTGMFYILFKLLCLQGSRQNQAPETTRPVAVTRDGSCVFNSVLAVDPVGQGQRR